MTHPWQNADTPIEERVEALMSALTLEEKAAQLGSYWIRPEPEVREGADVAPMENTFDSGRKAFDEAIAGGLGQLTRAFGSAPIEAGEGRARLAALQREVVAANRWGIPALAHEECLTGFTTLGATCYPASIAWGASFNPDLVREMASRIGTDMRSVGVHMGLSPVLDVVRDYRWGRVEETIGEDPLLVGAVATAYVQGLQSAGVIATLKHFAGYSAARAGRNHAPVSMGNREFEDVVLVPFEMAIRNGRAGAVMNSYSDVDGEPPAASHRMLTGILRDRWGFDGTVVSDYWSINFLASMHHVARDAADAGVLALSAGLDVELPETNAFLHLAEAVRANTLEEAVLDTAVRRVLVQKAGLGLLDEAWDPSDTVDEAVDLDSAANRELARRMAEDSIILLKNDGILPLGPTRDGRQNPTKIAVVGPSGDQPRTHLGCYTFTNHVLSRFGESGTGLRMQSLVEALRADDALAGVEIDYVRGVDFTDPDTSGIDAAVAAATAADIAVVTVGDLAGLFGTGTSGEGCDVVDLALPGAQAELVEAVLNTGVPTVLLVLSGRPYSLGPFAERAAAIVQAFMPGEEGGPALAAVLAGTVNPSGKLPVQIPDHVGGQPGTYLAPTLGWYSEGVSNLDPRPLYPFGFGMSYTTFEVDDLEIGEAGTAAAPTTSIGTEGTVEISAVVRNTGHHAGSEVVQLYLNDPVSQVVLPRLWLAGFAKVRLDAGQQARVTFTLHADRTSFTGRDGTRIVEPGRFDVLVGTSSENLPLRGSFEIHGDLLQVGEGRVLDTPASVDFGPEATTGRQNG